jgi:hypothetical protein
MMSDIVLEQRVSDVEKNLLRIGKKMELYGEESHDRLTRLEDWLIQYSITTQKNIEENRRENKQGLQELRQLVAKGQEDHQRWRNAMEEDHQKWRNAMEEDHQRWRLEMEESHRENKQGLQELRKIVAANQEESQKWRKSMEEDRRENKQGLQELRKIVAANQEESQKWRKSMEESHRKNEQELKEFKKSMADSQQNLEKIQQRNEQGFKELRKTIADSRKELGQISLSNGTIVEDLVAPSLPRVLKEMVNCPTEDDVLINVRVRRRHPTQKGKMLEIDAMADCGNYVLFNETKSQFSPEKVKAFLDKLALVRDYFPEYQHHQIRGCIASLYLDKSLIDYASRQGLLALASGEFLMTIQNETGFLWKAF